MLLAGGGTLVNAGGGVASYTFAATDAGRVTLALANTFVETLSVQVSDGTAAEAADEAPPLAFAGTGFRFLADGVPSAIGTLVAGKRSDLGAGAQLLELQAVRTDTETGACEAALIGSVTVELALECLDAAVCGVPAAAVNGVAVPANDAGAVAAWAPVGLDFGDAGDGTAALVLAHADAGAVRWHARHALADAAGIATGELMTGRSNRHVVRPFALRLDFSGDRAANATAGVSWAADAAGSAFAAAGADFDVSVGAVAWQAADDADLDGLPDAGASLYDNAITASFGSEALPAALDFSAVLVAPAGGVAGNLAGGLVGGFASGVADALLSWSEVGIVDLWAVGADYLGGGSDVVGRARNVGRFHPARLEVSDDGPRLRNGPDAGWSCGFTWLDQPFAFAADPVFTLTARSLGGAVTRNYGGAFFRLGPAPWLAARSYSSTATGAAALDAPAIGMVALAGADDLDGVATLTLSDEQFAYRRGSTPEEPFDAALTLRLAAADLTDADGVCHTVAGARCMTGSGDVAEDHVVTAIGGARLRFGRLRMRNAGGSELMPLPLPVSVERFEGGGFVTAGDDTCTSLPPVALDLVNDVEDPARGVVTIGIGAGSSSAVIASDPVLGGDPGLTFGAPGAGNVGHVEATFDLAAAGAEWLRHDWDGDGVHDDDPAARASFGIFSGGSQLINVREPWN